MDLNTQIALSFQPVETLIGDETITDIYIDGPEKIYCKRSGIIEDSGLRFSDRDELEIAVNQVARVLKVQLDKNTPYLDAKLPGGERINVVVDPIMRKGPCVTIRKFGKKRLTETDLIRFGAIDEKGIEILKFLVRNGKRIIISGKTNSGKTTLLNILCKYIPEESGRIITIEDTEELNFENRYWVSLIVDKKNIFEREEKYTEVLINTLRMDPEYLVLGEIRGKEAYALLDSFFTGHKGMATIHADSPEDVLYRLKILTKGNGSTEKEMITRVVDVVVQAELIDKKRVITSISEVIKGDEFKVNELYSFTKERSHKVCEPPMFLKTDKYIEGIPEFWNEKQ